MNEFDRWTIDKGFCRLDGDEVIVTDPEGLAKAIAATKRLRWARNFDKQRIDSLVFNKEEGKFERS